MTSDLRLKTTNQVHRAMLTLSLGHIGWTLAKMPVLKLTTTGRKSGRRRTVMLTSPHVAGDAMLIVASKGGDERHPAWFLNLRDDPRVEVETETGSRQEMVARIATPEERAKLWPEVVESYSGYAGYQAKTNREIPLIFLEPPHPGP